MNSGFSPIFQPVESWISQYTYSCSYRLQQQIQSVDFSVTKAYELSFYDVNRMYLGYSDLILLTYLSRKSSAFETKYMVDPT